MHISTSCEPSFARKSQMVPSESLSFVGSRPKCQTSYLETTEGPKTLAARACCSLLLCAQECAHFAAASCA